MACTTFDLILRVIIMITLFSSAYIAEVIRDGQAALPRGQYEAADSLGVDYAQSMKLITMPQALKISIPGIVNVAVGLFKETVLVSVISMFDLVGMIRGPILASTEWNGVYWELWGFAVLMFFPVCYWISKFSTMARTAACHRPPLKRFDSSNKIVWLQFSKSFLDDKLNFGFATRSMSLDVGQTCVVGRKRAVIDDGSPRRGRHAWNISLQGMVHTISHFLGAFTGTFDGKRIREGSSIGFFLFRFVKRRGINRA